MMPSGDGNEEITKYMFKQLVRGKAPSLPPGHCREKTREKQNIWALKKTWTLQTNCSVITEFGFVTVGSMSCHKKSQQKITFNSWKNHPHGFTKKPRYSLSKSNPILHQNVKTHSQISGLNHSKPYIWRRTYLYTRTPGFFSKIYHFMERDWTSDKINWFG